MIVLAVDPGSRYIGLAVSDALGIAARPLRTLRHAARASDAAQIASLAEELGAELILVGHPLDSDGQAGPQARHAQGLADAIRAVTKTPVRLTDESFSSQEAGQAMRAAGKTRQARRDQIHSAAAAAVLQGYLDAHSSEAPPR